MKTKLFMALAVFVTVFAACQKDPKDDTTDNGTTTEDYQPTSAGSTWQYNSTSQGTYTETALSTDTTIEGEKYVVFSNTANGRRYVNKTGGVYKSFGYVPQLDTTLSLVYLKDAAAGTTWTNTTVYSGFPVNLAYTIASRDGEKSVNGKDYKNVIALDFSVSATNPLTGSAITVATGQQFYAKGVGSILNIVNFKVQTTAVSDTTSLVTYDIK